MFGIGISILLRLDAIKPETRCQEMGLEGTRNVPFVLVQKIAEADCPTRWGNFRIFGYQKLSAIRENAIVLVMGDVKHGTPLIRVHSQCVTGEVFGSLRCDCGQQLEMALSMIAGERAGMIIYEEQEGRGIGLMAKLRAYELQDSGCDTVEANQRLGFKSDYRNYQFPAAILRQFGITKARLLTNNPDKVRALEIAGIDVIERVPCEVVPAPENANYLRVKKEKLDHLLTAV